MFKKNKVIDILLLLSVLFLLIVGVYAILKFNSYKHNQKVNNSPAFREGPPNIVPKPIAGQ